MRTDVIAIFDIGKTNKKMLVYNKQFELVHEKQVRFEEVKDDDGFECDDVDAMLEWMDTSFVELMHNESFNVVAMNFSTYGATLVYLNEKGERVAPVYNYLKPMPEGVLDGFYEKYDGIEEFSRKTASPALDMLNSGLQIYYLKKMKPHFYENVKYILHLPQYLSYRYTGKIVAGYPSIGCHTALWDFDNMKYHKWLEDEQIGLPEPVSSHLTYKVEIKGKQIEVGIGVHDSSASLVPYLKENPNKQFMLISSGTWAINMNPFSETNLTTEQLRKDCLCYLSVDQKQVKSSRLFLGHIHEVNTNALCEKYKVDESAYKEVNPKADMVKEIIVQNKMEIFPAGIPNDYIGTLNTLDRYPDFESAYHQLIYELSVFEKEAISMVIDTGDLKDIYLTGGFNKNLVFVEFLRNLLPGMSIHISDMDNATALGAAMLMA